MVGSRASHISAWDARIHIATDTLELIEDRLRMLPPEKLSTVLDFVTFLAEQGKVWDEADLESGYRAMAADEQHEREALEWIEDAPDEALE